MAKIPKVGKCVHCLRDPVELSWDHVFPKSWYPDATPQNLEKWQIPSCIPCNQRYSKIEGDLLSRVGLCLDPENPASASIVQAAVRSLKPSAGRDERDAALRLARGKKVLGEVFHGDQIPREAVIPGMGERWNRQVEEQIAVPIRAESLKIMTEKIVRGVTVECTKCDRKGRYHVHRLIEKYGRKANMVKWREMLNADCPKARCDRPSQSLRLGVSRSAEGTVRRNSSD